MCRKNVIFSFSGICPLLVLRNTGPRPKQVVFLGLLGQFVAHAELSRCTFPRWALSELGQIPTRFGTVHSPSALGRAYEAQRLKRYRAIRANCHCVTHWSSTDKGRPSDLSPEQWIMVRSAIFLTV